MGYDECEGPIAFPRGEFSSKNRCHVTNIDRKPMTDDYGGDILRQQWTIKMISNNDARNNLIDHYIHNHVTIILTTVSKKVTI